MGIARVAASHYLLSLLRHPLSVISLAATSHILSDDGRGLLTVVYLIPNMVLLFANFGTSSAALYFLGKDLAPKQRVLSTMLVSSFGFGVMWSLAIALAYATVPGIVSDQVTWLMHCIILIQLPFTVVNQSLAKLMVYQHRIGREFAFELVIKAGNLASLLIFGLWILRGEPASDIVLAIVCTTLTLNIVRCAVLLGRMRRDIAAPPSFALLKRMIIWGLPLTATVASMYLLHYGDQYLLQLLGADPLAMVGVYTVAYSIFMVVVDIPRSVGSIFLRVSLEAVEQESDRVSILIARRMAVLTIAVAGGLALVSPWAIAILTPPEFAEASDILRILLICSPLFAISAILERLLSGRLKVLRIAFAPLIALAVNVALNIAWIPEYGLAGAAWATVVAYGALFVVRLWTCATVVGWAKVLNVFAFSSEDLRFFASKAKAMLRILRFSKEPPVS
ncbi:MAG: polysaccharide biosynthesis C-terminal domain-containing protein [Planctomycetaceae bacterium]|nr:polysaccharide biosynthesis C-terminal domain-containing protein [Planctomycetaceae bacterium]